MAAQYAENDAQRDVIRTLVDYYITGDLSIFDEYSIKWTEDTASQVDFINGFIESYGDPLGMTGAWESIVNFKNNEASHRTEIISQNAQWFEDNSPVDPRFRKEKVKGVSAKVITAAILAGDAYPATPIGINLLMPIGYEQHMAQNQLHLKTSQWHMMRPVMAMVSTKNSSLMPRLVI